jgi:hypothetical protein
MAAIVAATVTALFMCAPEIFACAGGTLLHATPDLAFRRFYSRS